MRMKRAIENVTVHRYGFDSENGVGPTALRPFTVARATTRLVPCSASPSNVRFPEPVLPRRLCPILAAAGGSVSRLERSTLPKPVLFISHSTGDRTAGDRVVQVRDALQSRLGPQWDVFLDVNRSQGGAMWRPTILEHIDRARGAVVLFDLRATTRPWVQAEALMFSFRKSLAKSFQFVPVLFDGLKPSDTTFDKYEPFGLNEVQAIADRGQPISEFAEEIARCFDAAHAHEVPTSPWVSELLAMLECISTDGWAEAARALDMQCGAIKGEASEARRHLARCTGQLIHHRSWNEILLAVEWLLKYIRLRTTSRMRARTIQQRLCDHVRMKWVPNESVEVLLCALRRGADLGVLAVNAEESRLLREYQGRITSEFRGRLYVVSAQDATGETDAARLHEIRQAISTTLFPTGRLGRYDSGALMSLEHAVASSLAVDQRVVILVLPWAVATPGVVEALRRDFAEIVLLVVTPLATTKLPFPARWLPPRLTMSAVNDLDVLENNLQAACAMSDKRSAN
jgi:hypothetical protein